MQRAVTDLSRRAGVRFTRTAGIQDGARAFDRDVMAVTGKTSRRQDGWRIDDIRWTEGSLRALFKKR
jgi:hypothetical protein